MKAISIAELILLIGLLVGVAGRTAILTYFLLICVREGQLTAIPNIEHDRTRYEM